MVGIARQRTRESDPDYEHEQLDMNEYEDPQRTPGSKINGGGEHSQHPAASGSSSFASGESTDDEAEHRQTVDAALKKLRQVHGSSTGAGSGGWEKALKHKHGVDVYVRKDTVVVEGREKKVPLWKGELLIEGFSPAAVFAVAGQRKLWDEWYDSGNLVADLSESSSLVYMVMKPPATARTRDLALVEKVEADADGSIFFAATSIVSPRIPGVHGRTRATMILNGWVLRPIQKNGTVATMTSYYVQADAQGFLPSTLASKIMARRPVEIYKIQEHLKRFGAPSNARAASQDQQRGASYAHSGGAAAVGPNETGPQPRHANSRAALAGQAPEHEHPTEGTLPPQAPFVDSHASSQEIKTAKRKFEEALSERSWSSAVDTVGSTIYFNRQSAGSSSSSEARGATLPTVKGAAELSGVTSEQILGTITSANARCVWDEMYVASELVENISGDAQHQGIFSQSRKGIHPHLPNQVYTVAHAALRDEPNSDDGAITYVSRSYSTGKDRDPSAPEGSVEFAGWRVAPSDTGREGSHTATYIASRTLTPSGQPIPDFVERILLAAEAGKPRRLKEFIDVHGHAPFFLRWSEGAAALDEEEEGDLSEGRTSWRIGSRSASGSKGSSKGTEQVAWLQWSEKMYPHGIALSTSERISGLKAAHIEGSDTTLQLTFPSEVPEKGFTLSLARGEGEHAGDVTWNGERVSESVSAPQGAAAARRRAPVTAATVVSSKAQEQQRRPEQAASALHGSNQQPQGGRAVAGATVAPAGGLGASLPPVVQDLAVLHHIPRGRGGTRTLPDDAMLILSQDLYFTRSQMGVIGALLALVWTLAKLT